MKARIRFKSGTTPTPNMVKFTISIEPEILNPNKLEASKIDLNTKKGVQQVEKTILEKEETYPDHLRDSRKFSRAAKN